MAWSIVGVGTSVEVTTTAHALTVPAGVAAGDLLVACIASRIASTTSITLPAGGEWTLVSEQKANNVLTTGSAVASGMMAYCVRGASNPNLTFTHPAAPAPALGRIVAYRGGAAPTASAKDTQGSATTAVSITAVNLAGLTTTQANDLIVAMLAGGQEAAWSSFNATTPAGASGATDTTTAPTTTWIERADVQTTTGNDTSLGIFDALKATAGATGNFTATASVAASHALVAGAFKILPGTADAWNVNDKDASVTLSNADKTATFTAAVGSGVRATTSYLNDSGKLYAEVLLNTWTTGTGTIGLDQMSTAVTGLQDSNVNLNTGDIRSSPTVIGSIGSAPTSGDVICLAWDRTNKRVWWRKNGGLWNNDASADPATNTNGKTFTTVVIYGLNASTAVASSVFTIRTEAAEFTQAGPSGFTSWMGETLSTPVSANVTGQSITASVGDVTVTAVQNVSAAVTGQQLTASVGTVTVSLAAGVSASVTGQELATAVGTATVVGKATTTVTGQQLTASVGTATATGKATASVTGLQATAAVGTATIVGKATATLTGQEIASAAGPVTVTAIQKATADVTGQQVTALVNGVSVIAGGSISVSVSGQQVTASVGTATVTAIGGTVGVWNGSAWIQKPAMVWNGSAWARKPVKTWNGTSWAA